MKSITFHDSIAFLASFVGSSLAMLGIFIWTMLLHDQHIDYEYLHYSALRIAIISVVCAGIMATIFSKRKVLSFIGGAVLGPILGALFITFTS